jgi:SAM-dependent methyltransferase
MSDYDDFAWFYDRYWSQDALTWELIVLERLLLAELERGTRVLDACCGAGHLAAAMAGRGLSVTGFDLSAAMIGLARRHAPTVRFREADVREIDSSLGQFTAAVSMFDSLNHLLSVEDLDKAFSGIGSCLLPGGWFVFDLNTRLGIEAWGTMSHADDEAAFIVEPGFDPLAKRGEFRFAGFRKDGNAWRRIDAQLQQTWFSDDEVHAALRHGGFENVSRYDRAEVLGNEPSGKKLIFVARKRLP